jgi:DNA polymerase IV
VAIGFVWLARFAAEVEAQDIRQPVAVHRRGKIVSLTEPAEAVGLKVGIRLREAQAVGHEVKFVPFDEDHYTLPWRQVLDTCALHASVIEPVALGEAYLKNRTEVVFDKAQSSGICRILPPSYSSGRIGEGPSKLVARIAAEVAPGRTVAQEEAASFLAPLSVSHLGKWAEHLQALGITTIGLLQKMPVARLAEHFGSEARRLADLARGIDHSPVLPLYPPRVISVRLSLPGGAQDREVIHAGLRRLAARVAEELAQRKEACTRLSLRLELEGTADVSRSLPLRQPAMTADDLLRLSRYLFGRLDVAAPVTAVGLRASDLRRCTSQQLTLFDGSRRNGTDISSRAHQALASIHDHFGCQVALAAAEIEVPRRDRMLAAL